METAAHKRVLITDDSASMRHVLSLWFLALGWDVHTAEDGHDALRVLDQTGPDLLVTDNAMPGMTGLELIAAVREQRAERPQIIMITADSTVETLTAALSAGADDYLVKPVTLDRLEGTLGALGHAA